MQQFSHLIHQELYNKELATHFTTFVGSIIEKGKKEKKKRLLCTIELNLLWIALIYLRVYCYE